MKDDKSFKLKILLICIVSIITFASATYAFFYIGKQQGGLSSLETTCFGVEFTNGESINLTNAVSMNDENGQKTTPYTFTIKNVCDLEATYYILINTKEGSFEDRLVSGSLNRDQAKVISENRENTLFEKSAGYEKSYILKEGNLKKNETVTYDLRLWINASATYEEVRGKTWEGEIKVVSVVRELDEIVNTKGSSETMKALNLKSKGGTQTLVR